MMKGEILHPGAFLQRELEERNLSQVEFAEIMGRPLKMVNELLKGKKSITASTARELEQALGVSAEFWMNLESQYKLSTERGDNAISRRAAIFERTPFADIRKRKWIDTDCSIAEQEERVLQFLRVSSLTEGPACSFAARKGTEYSNTAFTNTEEAWCCGVIQLAEGMKASRFSIKKTKALIPKLQKMTPSLSSLKDLPEILRSAGIRFLIVKHLPKSKIDGGTTWLSKSKPVLAMSLRFGRIDYFWFTLFHELSHIINGEGGVDTDLFESDDSELPSIEERANNDAAKWLVKPSSLSTFVKKHNRRINVEQIRSFAKEESVHPGIVLGQLQHKGIVKWSLGRDLLTNVREVLLNSVDVVDGWEDK